MKTLLNCTMIIFGIFFYSFVSAQCPTGNITLSSQEDVNNFPSGCTLINGTLTIQGSDITDLSPLENITTISKALRIIQNDELTNLDGLENIISVGAYLRINKNGMLTNLDGLENMAVVGGYIEVVNNHELISLEGLSSLKKAETLLNISKNYKLSSLSGLDNIVSIGKYLQILENNKLTNLKGLGGLQSIEKGLRIQKNAELTTLEGLDNLTFIGGNVNILSNVKLKDLNGLEALTSARGFLKITGNPVLTSLRGLKNLASINGYIKIRNNNALTSLSGLENIDPESITNLLLTANGNLSYCNLPNICDYLTNGGNSNIKDNTGSCETKGAVQSACESLVAISSVESPVDINVECHTLFNNLELPSTVGVTFSDNTTGNMTVIWQESDYNKSVGSYNLTGLLDLMGPTSNPNNLNAQITVHVKDTIAPIPDISQLPELSGKCSVIVTDIPTATDNCEGLISATTNDPLLYEEQGTYTITWIYEDGNGHTSTQNQSVVVDTILAPVINCPQTHIVSCDPVVTFDLPEASDNCGPVNIVQTDNTGLTSGSVFPAGITTLTFQTTNSVESVSCSVDVEVLPELEIHHMSGIQNGDTLHIIDCLPPDISKDDLDLGYYQSRSPLHSNIYSRPLPPKHERPAGLWQVFLYSYEVKDLCGPTKTFEYNVALYDLEPPVFLNFPQDTTLEKTEDLPPVPHNVRILDICRYVVWDTVTTTPIVNPGTNDTMAYVRQWIAEDEAGNKSFRDQMIYIRDATRPDLNSIYGYVVKEADLQNAPFPAVAGTNGIPVTLYRIDADGMSIPVKSMITGNWQGYEGRLFLTSLLPGNYLLKIDVPKGYKTVHPDSLITEIGQSDTLSLSGNSTLNLGTIHLIRDTLSKNTPLIPEKFKVKRTIKSQRPEVRLYPNPSDGRVILEQSDSQQNYDFIVFNNLGQSVKHGTVQKNSEIDLTGQKNGLYFIRLEKNHTFLDVKKVLLISN